MAELPPPEYGSGALSDLMPSVLASLGVPAERAVLALEPVERVVVLLVDGLGAELLRRHADLAPYLSSLRGRDLTTGFPATTVTSLSSFGTGLPPGEHGLTGYTSLVEEAGATVGWLGWTPADGDEDLRARLPPEQVQPRPTVFERAQAAGVEVTVAAPALFEGSGLTRAVLRGGSYAGSVSAGDTVAQAVRGSRRGSRSLVYCYTADLDLTGHVRGVDSDSWRVQLRLVDAFAEQLAARLQDRAVLHVTGDHGMVDVADRAKVDLDARPDLREGVRAVAGEPRARHVHAEPGQAAAVLERWRAELGDQMWIGSRAEAVRLGLFGPVVDTPALGRIGDVVAVSTADTSIVQWQRESRFSALIGQHGALTDDERLVPLLSTR